MNLWSYDKRIFDLMIAINSKNKEHRLLVLLLFAIVVPLRRNFIMIKMSTI